MAGLEESAFCTQENGSNGVSSLGCSFCLPRRFARLISFWFFSKQVGFGLEAEARVRATEKKICASNMNI